MELVGATRSTVASTSCILGLTATMLGWLYFCPKSLAKRAILLAQTGVIEFLVHDHAHFGQRERLEDVVAGSGFHRLDCGFNRAECGHDDNGQAWDSAAWRFAEIQARSCRGA